MFTSKLVRSLDAATARPSLNSIGEDPSRPAPPLPKINHDSISSRKIDAKLASVSDETHQQDIAKWTAWAALDHSVVSSKTKKDRELSILLWTKFVQKCDASIKEDEVFDYTHVKRYLKLFLPWRLKYTPPRKGYQVIQASTLKGWLGSIAYCIVTFAYHFNAATRETLGIHAMLTDSLYVKLRDQVEQLTRDHGLGRMRHKKLYMGRGEFQALLGYALDSTKNVPLVRATVLQHIFRWDLGFYTTQRNSTNGVTDAIWAKLGYYLKVKNVRIFRKADRTWSVEIFFGEFKNTIGMSQIRTQTAELGGVLYAHNALFDPTVALVSLFLVRELFEIKYRSAEEFCNDTRAEITLDPAKKDQPLFLAVNSGGKGFHESLAPSTSKAIGDATSYWTRRAGLPAMAYGTFRRDAGNAYGLMCGVRMAQLIMHHKVDDDDVFREHYDRGVENLPLTSWRLGETAAPNESFAGEVLDQLASIQAFKSTIVETLVRQSIINDPEAVAAENKRQAHGETRGNAKIVEIDSQIKELYKKYTACFTNDAAKRYEAHNKNNVTRLWKIASNNEVNLSEKDKFPICFVDEMKKEAGEHKHELDLLYDKRTTATRQLNRQSARQAAFQHNLSFRDVLSGTTAQRNAAINKLKEIPHQVVDAMGEHLKALTRSDTPSNDVDTSDPCEYDGTDTENWAQSVTGNLIRDLEEELEEEDAVSDSSLLQLMGFEAGTKSGDSGEAAKSFDPESEVINEDDKVDEALETDVLKAPIGLVRQAMIEYFVAPIFAYREVLAKNGVQLDVVTAEEAPNAEGEGEPSVEITGGAVGPAEPSLDRITGEPVDQKIKGFKCDLCQPFVDLRANSKKYRTNNVFTSLSTFNRHKAQMHTEWKELELKMVTGVPKQFRCPAGDFVGKTIRSVQKHARQNSCKNVDAHRKMYLAHQASVQPYLQKKTTTDSDEEYASTGGIDVATIDLSECPMFASIGMEILTSATKADKEKALLLDRASVLDLVNSEKEMTALCKEALAQFRQLSVED
ncbi:hypothetical protein CPC08DRAFT_730610 [Agrocybe pediades]|nr:hypothetical protein CPC08DRAFT_730610 [Agrocybe pediades]